MPLWAKVVCGYLRPNIDTKINIYGLILGQYLVKLLGSMRAIIFTISLLTSVSIDASTQIISRTVDSCLATVDQIRQRLDVLKYPEYAKMFWINSQKQFLQNMNDPTFDFEGLPVPGATELLLPSKTELIQQLNDLRSNQKLNPMVPHLLRWGELSIARIKLTENQDSLSYKDFLTTYTLLSSLFTWVQIIHEPSLADHLQRNATVSLDQLKAFLNQMESPDFSYSLLLGDVEHYLNKLPINVMLPGIGLKKKDLMHVLPIYYLGLTHKPIHADNEYMSSADFLAHDMLHGVNLYIRDLNSIRWGRGSTHELKNNYENILKRADFQIAINAALKELSRDKRKAFLNLFFEFAHEITVVEPMPKSLESYLTKVIEDKERFEFFVSDMMTRAHKYDLGMFEQDALEWAIPALLTFVQIYQRETKRP